MLIFKHFLSVVWNKIFLFYPSWCLICLTFLPSGKYLAEGQCHTHGKYLVSMDWMMWQTSCKDKTQTWKSGEQFEAKIHGLFGTGCIRKCYVGCSCLAWKEASTVTVSDLSSLHLYHPPESKHRLSSFEHSIFFCFPLATLLFPSYQFSLQKQPQWSSSSNCKSGYIASLFETL